MTSTDAENDLRRASFPFFILGSDRSGTTMLRLMLNQHPEVAVPRETWFIADLVAQMPTLQPLTPAQVDSAVELITTHSRWADQEIPGDLLRDAVSRLSSPTVRSIVEQVYLLHLRAAGKPRWGDKTPEYVVHLPEVARLFPEAKFIHVVRDARDVSLSLHRKRWRGSRLANAARFWSVYAGTGARDGRTLPAGRYLEVRYEDLVLATRETLRKVCRFLELSYVERMERFYDTAEEHVAEWEKQHHQKTTRAPRPTDVARWKREASPFQIAIIEGIAGKTMELFGQERHFKGLSAVLPYLLGIGDSLLWRVLALRRHINEYLNRANSSARR